MRFSLNSHERVFSFFRLVSVGTSCLMVLMASERVLLRVWSWPKQCLFHQIKSFLEA